MTTPSGFLQGSFAPVTEEITAFNLPVTGQIPAELSGRYLRNGPNPLGLDEPGYRFGEVHWFLSRTATATAPSSARSATPPSQLAATSPTERSATPCSSTTSPRVPSRPTNSAKTPPSARPSSSPAALGAAEDDGHVMAYIHNPDRGAADLVLLGAQDFTAEPIARVHLPARIPLGFHGSWIPDK